MENNEHSVEFLVCSCKLKIVADSDEEAVVKYFDILKEIEEKYNLAFGRKEVFKYKAYYPSLELMDRVNKRDMHRHQVSSIKQSNRHTVNVLHYNFFTILAMMLIA